MSRVALTDAYSLHWSTILDSGSIIHIFNNRSRFLDYRTAYPNDFIVTDDSRNLIIGYGRIVIETQGSQGPRRLAFDDVAYCEGCACNLVSLRQLLK
jgi:hypothetical protein